MIYFDNAATTKVCDAAKTALNNYLQENFGNPSSLHKLGIYAESSIKRAKQTILQSFGCLEDEFIFTSGGTEANNLAIFGSVKKGHIITTVFEHASVLEPIKALEKQNVSVTYLKEVRPDTVKNVLRDDTVLVSIMAVNNESGISMPVNDIYKVVKRHGAVFHVDAVQAFLKFNINADLISVSGHKIHAPKGVGGLFKKKNIKLKPIFYGGGQEKNLRSGTESVPLIMAFEAAVSDYKNEMDRLVYYLKSKYENVISAGNGICLIDVYPLRAETVIHYMAENDIYVSSGSACNKNKVSHVLREMNVRNPLSVIRVSFCAENTESEIDIFLKTLENCRIDV